MEPSGFYRRRKRVETESRHEKAFSGDNGEYKKESGVMHSERVFRMEGSSSSLVVEMDSQGRLWLGLRVFSMGENGSIEQRGEPVEVPGIQPGHLGRDGEWW